MVPPAFAYVHVLNQDLSRRNVVVGLPGLPPAIAATVISHHPHSLRRTVRLSLLHVRGFFTQTRSRDAKDFERPAFPG